MATKGSKKEVPLSPLYTVRGVVILDMGSGERLAAKYSPWWSECGEAKDQVELEKRLFAKAKPTKKGSLSGGVDIAALGDTIALHRGGSGVRLFVLGASDENELLLLGVLNTIWDALCIALAAPGSLPSAVVVDRLAVLENFDTVLLILDETLDDGIILESDPALVAYRATMRASDGSSLGGPSAAEQNLSQALHLARDTLIKVLR